jgi:phenylacetic acid degradation operon negative regulatory protein
MKKIKIRATDWFLLGLAGFLDFVEEVNDPFRLMENYYRRAYGFVPGRFTKSHYLKMVWKNINKKYIKKEKNCKFIITGKGLKKIQNRYPSLYLKNKKWDGRWRLVIFDISEKHRVVRDTLRKTLKLSGFLPIQKSVWISQTDLSPELRSYLMDESMDKEIIIIETKKLFVKNMNSLIHRLWPVDEINNGYKKIFEVLDEAKNRSAVPQKRDDRRVFGEQLKNDFLGLYLKESYLPKKYLPDNWYGDRVKKLIKN